MHKEYTQDERQGKNQKQTKPTNGVGGEKNEVHLKETINNPVPSCPSQGYFSIAL